jgi:hypothetical protein
MMSGVHIQVDTAEAQPAEPQFYPATSKTCCTRKGSNLPTITDMVVRPATFIPDAKTRSHAESSSGIVHVRHFPMSTTPQSSSATCTTNSFPRSTAIVPTGPPASSTDSWVATTSRSLVLEEALARTWDKLPQVKETASKTIDERTLLLPRTHSRCDA